MYMKTKLICSDIDGTLLNKERELSTRTIAAIKKHKGIPFILISSRMPQAMRHLQQELNISHLPLIAYNGGLIVDGNNVLHSTEITVDCMASIDEFCSSTSLHLSLYHRDEWYVPTMDYWAKREQNNTKVTPQVQQVKTTLQQWEKEEKGAHKIMCMGDEHEIDLLVSFLEKEFTDTIIGYRSKATYLEISPAAISKKTAIEYLLKTNYPELNLSNVLAFGDNYNDIEMLTSVGLGIAVQNAKTAVLAIADKTTLSNIEDGVAVFLDTLLK